MTKAMIQSWRQAAVELTTSCRKQLCSITRHKAVVTTRPLCRQLLLSMILTFRLVKKAEVIAGRHPHNIRTVASYNAVQMAELMSWVNQQLVEKFFGAPIEHFEATVATPKGTNFLGELQRISARIRRKSGVETKSIILKRIPPDEATSVFMENNLLLKIEHCVYSEILPRCYDFMDKHAPRRWSRFSPNYLGFDAEARVMAMEDLCASGFELVPTRFDLQMSRVTAQQLAIMHASTAALYAKEAAIFHEFLPNPFSDDTKAARDIFVTQPVLALAEYVKQWPDFAHRYYEKLKDLADRAWSEIQRVAAPENNLFNVLNHGDLWVNNVMFSEDRKRAKFVDFQMSHIGSPALDILFFFYSSFQDDVMFNHFDELVCIYHKTLCEVLDSLKCTELAPSYEDLMRDIDDRIFYGMFSIAITLPFVLLPPEDRPSGEEYSKFTTPELWHQKVFSCPGFDSIIRKILPIFDSKGLFNTSNCPINADSS